MVVVVLAGDIVVDVSATIAAVVDGVTGLIGCTVTPAQPTTRMSAAKSPGSLFIRPNFGTARRLIRSAGQRIAGRPLRDRRFGNYACASTGSIR